tara:strand:+ start:1774 stop:2487 length:714 start_codon:yes stop_codon:yes gene_type:complete
MISFSIDVDWVNDFVLEDTLKVFEENEIKCTIFTTHKTTVLSSLNSDLFEIGLHPNFNKLLNRDAKKSAKKLLHELKNNYPDSIGIRSHSLVNSTYLSNLFVEIGMKYESNILLPYQKLIKPFQLWNGLYRTSFNWEDDIHFMYKKSFDSLGLDMLNEDIVFNFHPIHVFINSENTNRYNRIKDNYHDTDILKKNINYSEVKGTRDLMLDCIRKIKKNGIKTTTLKERFKDIINDEI